MFTYVISDKIDFQYDFAYRMQYININKVRNLQPSRPPSFWFEYP